MKKIFAFAAVAAAMSLAACSGSTNKGTAEEDSLTIESVAPGDIEPEAVVGVLSESVKAGDAETVAETVKTVEAELQEIVNSGDVEKAAEYASQVKAFVEENAEKLEDLNISTMTLNDIINAVKELPSIAESTAAEAAEAEGTEAADTAGAGDDADRAAETGADAEPEEEEEDEETRKKRWLWKLLSAIVAVVSVVVFLLTEDMTNTMRLVDRWTILMVLLLIGLVGMSGTLVWTLRRGNDNRMTRLFTVCEISIVLWLLSQLLILFSESDRQIWISYVIGNIGISAFAPFWLMFSGEYADAPKGVRRAFSLLPLISVSSLCFVLTNPLHHLYYAVLSSQQVTYGVLFYLYQVIFCAVLFSFVSIFCRASDFKRLIVFAGCRA